MDRDTFEARLRRGLDLAVQFAREYVIETLPDDMAVRVYPNCSFDGNPRVGDEVIFPNDSLMNGQFHGPWSPEQAVEFLWRDDRIPEWIDVAVSTIASSRTVVSFHCCGRFTAQENLLYHQNGGLSPFSIKSPTLPPGWESIETSGKFSLPNQDRDR